MTSNQKILVIGIDGATFNIINKLIEKNKLKNFQMLLKKGSSATLLSTIPDLSPIAWTTFATGKNAAKHGIYGFVAPKQNSYEVNFINANFRRAEPFWSMLSRNGKKVCIINMPISYPPDMVNGYFISGMDTPSTQGPYTYPPELKEEIEQLVPDYMIEYPILGAINSQTGINVLKNLEVMEDNRAQLCRCLMKKLDWTLFFSVFIATDRIQHFFWHYLEKTHPRYNEQEAKVFRNAIYNIYQKMDAIIGSLLAEIDNETTVIIMSDHGFGPFDDTVPYLNLNDWLIDNGLLNLKKRVVRRLIIHMLIIARSAMRKLLPAKIKTGLKNSFFKSKQWLQSYLYFADIDWSWTKAYATWDECMSRCIRINLKGREPHGTVNPGAEYESLRKELIQKISSLKHPLTGDKIVERVFKREDLFHGEYLEEAPDLIVFWNDDAYFSSNKLQPRSKPIKVRKPKFRLSNIQRSGEHRREGIFIISGPNIKKSLKINSVNIEDIAPTILYLLKQPIPEDMDGRVLTEVIEEPFLDENPVKKTKAERMEKGKPKSYSEEDEEEIKKRLRDLGYIN